MCIQMDVDSYVFIHMQCARLYRGSGSEHVKTLVGACLCVGMEVYHQCLEQVKFAPSQIHVGAAVAYMWV